VLIPSLYATSLRTRSLRPVRVPSGQNTKWRLPFYFSTNKRQEFLVSHICYIYKILRVDIFTATPHTCDNSVEKLSKKIGDVAFAIQNLSKNQLDVNELYTEVMKIEDFEEITLGDAFDHLVQNEMLAKAFMAKNVNLRKILVQNFVNQHYYRPDC